LNANVHAFVSRLRLALIATAGGIAVAAPAAHGQLPLPLPTAPLPAAPQPLPDLTVPAARDTEPVVLTGAQLPTWAVPANQTFQPPLADFGECPPSFTPQSEVPEPTEDGADDLADGFSSANCPEGYDPHNHYAEPLLETGASQPAGPAIDRLLGYRWNAAAERFVQIPFQVDEQFTRYLDNTASGFAIYSGQDQHTTYAYDGAGDREGFRYTNDGPAEDPCRAQPASPAQGDPVPGLDTNDELAFMASDAGPQAPADARRPRGIEDVQEIRVTDPSAAGAASYVYVMRARADGPRAAFDASSGHVQYERDANAGMFAFSQSSYGDYGAAAAGLHCDDAGNVVRDAGGAPVLRQRRPRDTATIKTKRYRYRYDGRWLMSDIRISGDGGETFGPDLVDRWKARAFAQDPGSETPCCGYEEEDTNWGGSSILLGERSGPVRTIRETWGADSGTNVIRRETFYRDEVVQRTWLRVHVIPALDGIYAQWDFNAGAVDRFYNTRQPAGVPIDGRNDEVFGNFDDPCNSNFDANDTSETDQDYRDLYRQLRFCEFPYHFSIDAADPTFGDANAALGWSVTAGPSGSIVDRVQASVRDLTPGGLAQSTLAVPYYRDDSCFDDGTGTDPGPKLKLRSANEPRTYTKPDGTTAERECWTTADGTPDGSDRFFQGSIGTHGLHILMVAESDNARLTVPVNEIVSDWRMVMLPGRQDASAGERYGRGFEKPLLSAATPASFEEESAPAPPTGGNGNGQGSGNSGNGQGNGGGNGTGNEGASNRSGASTGNDNRADDGLVLSARQGRRVRSTLPTACTGRTRAIRACRVTLTDRAGRVLGSARIASAGSRRIVVPVILNAQGRRILGARRAVSTLVLRARAVDTEGRALVAASTVTVRP